MSSVDFFTVLTGARQHFLVRAYVPKTGQTKYVEAEGRVEKEAITLVFKATVAPLEEMLMRHKPIVLNEKAASEERVFSHCRAISMPAEKTPNIQETVSDLIDHENDHVKSVFVYVEFGSLEEFLDQKSLDPGLLAGVANLCKSTFPMLNAEQSAFDIRMGDKHFNFESALKLDEDLTNIRFVAQSGGVGYSYQISSEP